MLHHGIRCTVGVTLRFISNIAVKEVNFSTQTEMHTKYTKQRRKLQARRKVKGRMKLLFKSLRHSLVADE